MPRSCWSLVLLLLVPLPVAAQDGVERRAAEAVDNTPTELGIRFTPRMARGMAKKFTDEVLIRHYEMDKTRAQEAEDLVTRRLMKLAHGNEDRGQEVIEWAATEGLRIASQQRDEDNDGFPRELGQGLGQRLLPFMPVVREFVDGTVSDIRPMLGVKGQLKLAGELTVVKMGLDAFEENMKEWSKGNVDPEGNPFEPKSAKEVTKNSDGISSQLQGARMFAEREASRGPADLWAEYVTQAKKYYGFDVSQAASADSLLRDFQQRAAALRPTDPAVKTRNYRTSLWWSLSWQLPGRWENPVRFLTERRREMMNDSVNALGSEFKRRIDELATQAQRDAAEQRVISALAEKGFDLQKLPPARAGATQAMGAQP